MSEEYYVQLKEEGNSLYHDKDYAGAIEKYGRAIEEAGENAVLTF